MIAFSSASCWRGEVALRLEQLERRRQADGHPLLLRLVAALGELARLARGFDALQGRVHLPRRVAHRGRDLQLERRAGS